MNTKKTQWGKKNLTNDVKAFYTLVDNPAPSSTSCIEWRGTVAKFENCCQCEDNHDTVYTVGSYFPHSQGALLHPYYFINLLHYSSLRQRHNYDYHFWMKQVWPTWLLVLIILAVFSAPCHGKTATTQELDSATTNINHSFATKVVHSQNHCGPTV